MHVIPAVQHTTGGGVALFNSFKVGVDGFMCVYSGFGFITFADKAAADAAAKYWNEQEFQGRRIRVCESLKPL